jgi:hypothetical protein
MARHGAKSAEEIEDRAITIRPSATAVFAVDSGDRYGNINAARGGSPLTTQIALSSPYQFSITRNQSLFNGFFRRIALTEIVFPYYIPNVNLRTQDLFYDSSVSGANQSISLGQAFYTPSQLAAAVQAALIADGAIGVTVVYLDGKFVVDAGAGNTIAFEPGSSPPSLPSINNFQLFDMMGFSSVNSVPARFQTSRVTRARYTEYLDIVCSQLTYNQDLKDSSTDPTFRDVMARVYLECENDQPIGIFTTLAASSETTAPNSVPGTYPFTIYRQFKNPKQIQWDNTQPLGNVTFEVYDSHGDLLANLTSVGTQSQFPDWRIRHRCQ